jgi:hypothetical protein
MTKPEKQTLKRKTLKKGGAKAAATDFADILKNPLSKTFYDILDKSSKENKDKKSAKTPTSEAEL